MKAKFLVEPIEEKGKHYYKVGDEKYPSVTGILGIIDGGKSTALMNWAKKMSVNLIESELVNHIGENISEETISVICSAGLKEPEKVFEKAGNLGSVVHYLIDKWIECELNGKKFHKDDYLHPGDNFYDEVDTPFENFLLWTRDYKIKWIMGDTCVASPKYKYGGRFDAVAQFNGRVYLVDFKTTNYFKADQAVQLGGYGIAFSETYGKNIKNGIVVRFSKDSPDFSARFVEMPLAKKAFLLALKLKNIFNSKLWR